MALGQRGNRLWGEHWDGRKQKEPSEGEEEEMDLLEEPGEEMDCREEPEGTRVLGV